MLKWIAIAGLVIGLVALLLFAYMVFTDAVPYL